MTDPFLRWPGGKRSLLPRLRPLLRVEREAYREPFVGGAAVFLDLRPERAVLSDANGELIETYEAVRSDPEGVIAALRSHDFTRERYLETRAMDPTAVGALAPTERAARFVFLNRLAFNGLQRQNGAGQSNAAFAPFDRRRLPTLEGRIRQASRALQPVTLMTADFADALLEAEPGDLVFADPPYDETFTEYVAGGFSREDQERLARLLAELAERGVRVITTNADTLLVRELYAAPTWTVHELPIRRNIAGDASSRRSVVELAITNYEPDAVAASSAAQVPDSLSSVTNATANAPQTTQRERKMPQEGGRGRRLPEVAVRERVEFVAELIKGGMGRQQVLAAFRERFGDVATRTVDDYQRRAREAWPVEAVAPASLPEKRAAERSGFLTELGRDVAEAKAAGVWHAVAALRRLEADVRGLRVLHSPGAQAGAPTVNVAVGIQLSPEQREHRHRLLRRVLDGATVDPAPEGEAAEPVGRLAGES